MVQGTMVDLAAFLPALQSAAESHAAEIADAVRAEAPVKTGAFAAGITAHADATGDGATVIVEGDAPLADWIIQGTAPHEIRPVSSKVLAFEVGSGGTVFTRVVHHPGTQPNDFPAKADLDSVIDAIVTEALAAVAG